MKNAKKPSFNYQPYLKTLLCLSVSVFFFCALLSYNFTDPSFNRATNAEVKNFAGPIGAHIADPVLQLFGLSAFMLAIIPLCWSIVYLYRHKVAYWPLRLIVGLIATSCLALMLSYIDISNHYFGSFGGVIGLLLKAKLSLFIPKIALLSIALVILCCSCYLCFAFTNDVWLALLGLLVHSLNLMIKIFFMIIKIILRCFTRKTLIEERIIPSFKMTNTKISAQKASPRPSAKIHEKFVQKEGFILPSTELLKDHPVNKELLQQNNAIIKKNADELIKVLSDFGVFGELLGSHAGPVVTLYELEPAAGTKSSRIIGLSDDIARSMRAVSTRIAVVPGRNAIGIELPNKQRETVFLKELLESSEYREKSYELPIILGKDIAGKVIVVDLARMPHLLVAGTTGSGKSVAINTMILSLLYSLTPDQCKFIMVDPKMLELSVYEGIPHLLTNVVTEPGKAVVALKWVVKEMENRYRLMSNLGVRNINNYNDKIREAAAKGEIIQRIVQTGFDTETGQPTIEQVPLDMKTLPFIVVIVDEMADLMLVAGKDIETSIQRLAQMARAAGIHIIMATQRPSVDVITGVIKANFPTRISFQVSSKIDSRTILNEQGAEQLLGKGDMLYMAGGSKISRIHGPFVADNEVEKIVAYLKSQGQPSYITDVTIDDEEFSYLNGSSEEKGDLYQQAVRIVLEEGKVSTSFIQRCLKIGYNRAATIIEQMEKEGVISKANHVGKREILIK